MDLVTARIEAHALEARLARLPPALMPVADFIRAELPADIHVETGSDVLLVRHKPENGTHAFAITMFPPAARSLIARYEELLQVKLPQQLRSFLEQVNGGFFLQLSLYGIPLSMARDPPLLSRTGRNPLDISTAAYAWRVEFPAQADEFHFGSRNAGWTLQYGYFLRSDGSVVRYRKGGGPEGAEHWPSFTDFLRDELEETRRHHPAFLADVEAGERKSRRRWFFF